MRRGSGWRSCWRSCWWSRLALCQELPQAPAGLCSFWCVSFKPRLAVSITSPCSVPAGFRVVGESLPGKVLEVLPPCPRPLLRLLAFSGHRLGGQGVHMTGLVNELQHLSCPHCLRTTTWPRPERSPAAQCLCFTEPFVCSAQETEGAGRAGEREETRGEAAQEGAETEGPRVPPEPEEAGEATGGGAEEAAGEDQAGGAQAAAGPAQPAVHPADRRAAQQSQGTARGRGGSCPGPGSRRCVSDTWGRRHRPLPAAACSHE